MTHLLNQQRHGPVPMGDVEVAVNQQLGQPRLGGGVGNRARIKNIVVHILRCDKCGNESHNQPAPEYETYVPDGWGMYPDGTHRCPDCRTKQALEQDERTRRDIIKAGGSVDDLRASLRAVHANEAPPQQP